MREITTEQLAEIRRQHKAWLCNAACGKRADLSGADLSGADLSGANLSGADLSGANLSGACLSEADLSGADLSEAFLSEADLSEADLSGADLSGAYLSGADLIRAYLSGADLSRADLSGADLSGAFLSEADLSRANLSGAKGIWVIGPGGSRGDMLYAVAHRKSIMLKTGCFWGTPDEFHAAVASTYGDGPEATLYLAKLALLEQMAAHARGAEK